MAAFSDFQLTPQVYFKAQRIENMITVSISFKSSCFLLFSTHDASDRLFSQVRLWQIFQVSLPGGMSR